MPLASQRRPASRPSNPLSAAYQPRVGVPRVGSLEWGQRRKAKKSSARVWVFDATGTVQGFIGAIRFLQLVRQVLEESRQGGESPAQASAGITVEVPFTAEAVPLAEDNQGKRLGAGSRPGWWL